MCVLAYICMEVYSQLSLSLYQPVNRVGQELVSSSFLLSAVQLVWDMSEVSQFASEDVAKLSASKAPAAETPGAVPLFDFPQLRAELRF